MSDPINAPSGPESFEALKETVAELSPSLPKRLLQCARFLLDNPDEVALGTAASVARAAGVQASTWVRFAQVVGYSGFSEMQDLLKANLLGRGAAHSARLTSRQDGGDATPLQMLAAFVESASVTLSGLPLTGLNEAIDNTAKIISEADTIHLLGIRRSYPVASYLFYAFGKIGFRCTLLDDAGGMLSDRVRIISKSDALLVVTFHPYAPETAEIAETVAQRGSKVVSITDSAIAPITQIAAEHIIVRDAEASGVRSLSVTMLVASALVAALHHIALCKKTN